MSIKKIFDNFISNEEWRIEKKGWKSAKQGVDEALFTIGNGVIGMRGILEEIPYDASAGTYIAGLYDRTGAQIPELVNFPNPIFFRADVYGEKLDPAAMDVLEHCRALDMKHGLLVRHTLYKTTHNKRIDWQSFRFISQYQKHVGVMVIGITPLDAAMTFNIQTMIDISTNNRGVFTEGRKKHYEINAISKINGINYTEVETFEHRDRVGYATILEVSKNGSKKIVADKNFKIRISKGQTVIFTKYFTIVPSFYIKTKDVKKKAISEIKRARKLGVQRLFVAHAGGWDRLWNIANIKFEGPIELRKALKFNLYHLLIAGNKDDRVSIGARTLSGEGYKGHIFWDAETFILPFYVFTHPPVARSMLMYRYFRLDEARKIAASKGFKGVLFPWESADTGEEATPSWFKDLNGEILRITTLDREHHLVADIAYAIDQYVTATGDEQFMINYGLEMLLETARFWLSRLTYNKKADRYEIHNVMGPDEFHDEVNNNTFTNGLAKWNLLAAGRWYGWARRKYNAKLTALCKKINIKESEIKKWRDATEKIYFPYNKRLKIFESFDGYFKRKEIPITQLDQHFMPIVPPSAHPVEKGKSKLIKQADVVMLMYMLSRQFTTDEIERNYNYYEKRTLHKSSLSPSVHACVAARLGYLNKALHYLVVALQSDILDIHGNANEGFHAASGGGAWQAFVMGFGGMEIDNDKIIFNPLLPPTWKNLEFKVWWQGAVLNVLVTKKEVVIKRIGIGKTKRMIAEVSGVTSTLPPGKKVSFPYHRRII
ncbi:MAG: glycosyl hydrolase family 65 protein [Pseudomonadota bacterium]